jgi:hypothetical protein
MRMLGVRPIDIFSVGGTSLVPHEAVGWAFTRGASVGDWMMSRPKNHPSARKACRSDRLPILAR